jgi:hypothetical protein
MNLRTEFYTLTIRTKTLQYQVIQVNFRLSGGGDLPLVLAYICAQCDEEAVEIRYAKLQGDEGRKQ